MSYREGVVIAVVAGRLMNAATWNDIPLVVSCTLVPREQMSVIVKAWENIKGAWDDVGQREEELLEGGSSEHSFSELQNRIEQIASHEDEIAKNMERCMEQQDRLAQLVKGLGTQLSQLQVNSVPNVAGEDFPTPGTS